MAVTRSTLLPGERRAAVRLAGAFSFCSGPLSLFSFPSIPVLEYILGFGTSTIQYIWLDAAVLFMVPHTSGSLLATENLAVLVSSGDETKQYHKKLSPSKRESLAGTLHLHDACFQDYPGTKSLRHPLSTASRHLLHERVNWYKSSQLRDDA